MCFEQGVFPYKTKLANKQNLEIESKEFITILSKNSKTISSL